jgi:hypothetical protein
MAARRPAVHRPAIIAEVTKSMCQAWVDQRRTPARSKAYVKKGAEKRTVSMPPVAEGTVTRGTMNPQHFRDGLARAAKRLGIPRLSPFATLSRRSSSRRAATFTYSADGSATRPFRLHDATTPASWTPKSSREPPDSPVLAGRRRGACHTKCHTAAAAKSFVK